MRKDGVIEMFRQSQDKQMTMNDRLVFANEQTRKAVDGSRAKLVGDIIYPNVDEAKFASLFSEKGSRPNIEIAQYVSALVLKRMYNLSDENLMEFLRCGATVNNLRGQGRIQKSKLATEIIKHWIFCYGEILHFLQVFLGLFYLV